MLRGRWLRSNCIHSIISRRRRECGCVLSRWERFRYPCKNNEPRSPVTTGVLVFGVRPPKGRLQYRVELASHDRAAVVQHLAESTWLPNRSFFCSVFVTTKAVQWLSTSASRATADSATARKRVLVKPVGKSVAATTEPINKLPMGGETMQTANARIDAAKRGRK